MTLDTRQIASAWLDSCSAAFTSDDVAGITHLFLQDGWLRDFLVFTWDLRSLAGREKIATYLTGVLGKSQITDVRLNETSDLAPRIFPFGPDKTSGIEFAFSFNCTHGIGRAHVRVVPDTDGVYRAYTLLMELQDLVGHEERSTLLTRDDVTHVAGRNMQQEYEEMVRNIETKPHALIIGGGQTGLQVAARFKQMNIPALVIERTARIGDTWRQRYPTLTLHTVRKQHSLLYQSYPSNWPQYTSRDKIADWLEHYASIQDVVVWTNTELRTRPIYDAVSGTWNVTLHRAGTPTTLRPTHIVLATGSLGRPRIPSFPNEELFRGQRFHSSAYPGGAALAGRRVVVIGAGQSAADLCSDLSLRGAAEVTMVQRSTSCVMTRDYVNAQVKKAFPEGVPMEVSDLRYTSHPLGLTRKECIANFDSAMAENKELHDKLRKGGVHADLGPEGQGVYPLVYERFGGFWMDKGCADKIASGAVKVKGLTTVERFTKDGIVLGDGTELVADAVIFATGYIHMREMYMTLFGEDVLGKTDKDWGLDEEGEINGSYKPCGFPGLWFATGDFCTSRIYSKQLALQIKAIEIGLMPYDGVREAVKVKAQ